MSRANVKDKRKAQLIAAALESIAKRGIIETTITHIAQGAGMSRGIINFYFSSKEMMLRETLKTLIEDYEAIWGDALHSSDTGRVRLDALVRAHFDRALCSHKRLNIMSAFWGHAASQVAYRHQLEASDEKIETALTEALAHTLSCDLEEAREASSQLHALIRGLWLTFMLNPQRSSREALAAQALAFIDRLVGAPVRIVRDVAGAETQVRSTQKPSAKKVKPLEAAQLDIEDLFTPRKAGG